MEIQPVKIVHKTVEPAPSNASVPFSDTPEARLQYDPRLLSNLPIVEAYRHYPLIQFFNLTDDEKQDNKINEQLKTIYKWASRRTNDGNIVHTLSQLERSIGYPELGDTRLNKLYGFATIENQIDDLEQQKVTQYGR